MPSKKYKKKSLHLATIGEAIAEDGDELSEIGNDHVSARRFLSNIEETGEGSAEWGSRCSTPVSRNSAEVFDDDGDSTPSTDNESTSLNNDGISNSRKLPLPSEFKVLVGASILLFTVAIILGMVGLVLSNKYDEQSSNQTQNNAAAGKYLGWTHNDPADSVAEDIFLVQSSESNGDVRSRKIQALEQTLEDSFVGQTVPVAQDRNGATTNQPLQPTKSWNFEKPRLRKVAAVQQEQPLQPTKSWSFERPSLSMVSPEPGKNEMLSKSRNASRYDDHDNRQDQPLPRLRQRDLTVTYQQQTAFQPTKSWDFSK